MNFVQPFWSPISELTPEPTTICCHFDKQTLNDIDHCQLLQNNLVDNYTNLEPPTSIQLKHTESFNISILDNTNKNLNNEKKKSASSNVKAYICSLCDYKTHYKPYFFRHRKILHPNHCFVCTLCEWNTLIKSSLKRHIQTLHSTKIFFCNQCEFQTCRKDTFTLHSKKIHI